MKTIERKVIVLGPQGAGKTSTVIRYVEKSQKIPRPTIGASFFCRKLLIDNVTIKLQIWDTAGQERFKCLVPKYYRDAKAALIVFDITSAQSFKSMQDWVLELTENVNNPKVLCVVGNKIDLAENRQVSRDKAIEYASSIGATYHECSALQDQDQGVEKVFDNVARELIKLYGTNVDLGTVTGTGQEEAVNLSNENKAGGNNTGESKCC
jgi:Ras-related protein Rab-21